MFWCSLVGADHLPKEAMPVGIGAGRFGFWCPLLGAESNSCGENSLWKGPTFRQVRVEKGMYAALAGRSAVL